MSTKICEQCGADGAKLYCYWPAVLCSECASNRVEARREKSPQSPQVRKIPNHWEPDHDAVLSPTTIRVPMVLIENSSGDRSWHPETMDPSTAERFAESMNCHRAGSATVFYIPVIVPTGSDIDNMLSTFRCSPVRAEITETIEENVFEEHTREMRAAGLLKTPERDGGKS
ncbi:hypothetical protein [Rhodopirellula sp. SWK7]|uniref:hypothetical protein n=1 Tax=Rhodopirellula sp. SWK7 TaxID=595460 RepID=UPI0002BD628D|nr:hypothetical protein [Rhodopirellula sp. SWK7]EMI40544.1 hypothetical protein RRSWK_06953 [Rhodopirellula sp. SWK7]